LTKRFFILFWLIAAYAVVFAHSAVPHQHHEEQAQTEAAHHHHHDDRDQHDDSAQDPSNPFHHFQHQGATADCFVPSGKYKAPVLEAPVAVLTHALLQLEKRCIDGPPLKHYKKELDFFRPQQERFYFHSVKAPPALS
jgi:hypothetical protein